MTCRVCRREAQANELFCYNGKCESCFSLTAERLFPSKFMTAPLSDSGYKNCWGDPGRTAVEPSEYLKMAEGT